jgi:hypothetical protein
MTANSKAVPVLVAGVALAVIVTVIVAVVASQRLPEGPIEPVWDQQACAFCRMHVGEPRFAAQLQTRGGEIHWYDDPGCLAEHETAERAAGRALDVHAIWLRHLREPRWVAASAARFVQVTPTPMGFGFGVVDGEPEGALGYADFVARIGARKGAAR